MTLIVAAVYVVAIGLCECLSLASVPIYGLLFILRIDVRADFVRSSE